MGEVKYDVRSVFEKIPQIVKMELTRKGEQWQGPYYLNGEPHPWRRDKVKFYKFKGSIWATEEGGQTISMTTWLQNYGGAADYWDAVNILKGVKSSYVMPRCATAQSNSFKVVGMDVLYAAKQWDLKKCPLFVWMCGIFGEEKVRKVWDLYNVTTDKDGNAVFWATDVNGDVLHDKRMRYLSNGHRDKSFGGSRKYTSAKGFTGRCMFGAHLAGNCKHVRVVESEKTALLAALYTGKVFLATGGKNALRDVDNKMILYPDMDAISDWSNRKGAVVQQWWLDWPEVTDHADYGDYIEFLWRKGEI